MSNLKLSIAKIKAMEISNGLKNQIRDSLDITSNSEKKIFNDRKDSCNECPHNDFGRCSLCGCILKIKQKSLLSDCPDKRWKELNI